MSRNLCKTECDYCGIDAVVITGERYIDPDHWSDYYKNFPLADAQCKACGAKYTAHLRDHHGAEVGKCTGGSLFRPAPSPCCCQGCTIPFFDLSYRSTFNDEPGEADIPQAEVQILMTIHKGGEKSYKRLEDLE